MIRYAIAIAIFIAAIVTACQRPPEKQDPPATGKLNGLQKYYYPDGELYMEIHFKDSVPDGLSRQYFKNGKVFEECTYANGVKHGPMKTYYEDGKLSSETPYENGKIHGIRKKFRKDGTPAFEAPFYQDEPCAGLKEFYLSGKPVEFPTIVIRPENALFDEGRYTLRLSLSKKAKVNFYKGHLEAGKYLGKGAEILPTDRKGDGMLSYYLSHGDFVMEELNIIAKVTTDLGNTYITQKRYNLSVENR